MRYTIATLALLFSVLPVSAQNVLFPANPGDMIYRGSDVQGWRPIPGGTAGCVLTSNGSTAAATWNCALALNFQLPPMATNTVWGNVSGVQGVPTQVNVSQFLNTIDYDVQRPPLPGAVPYKGTDNLWHTQPPPSTPGWVLTAQGTGAIPQWAPQTGFIPPGIAGTCLVSNGTTVAPSFQACPAAVSYVSSFNTRTGAVTLLSSDLPAPFTSGTRSGNTSEFATVSGSLTSGHAVKSDSSGNLIDAGAAPAIIQSGSVTLQVDHATGVDAATCGFGTGASACNTIYYAFHLFQTTVKVGVGGVSTIQSDCGFTETPSGAFLGPASTGTGVVFIVGNTGAPASCTWTSNGIIVDDGAVLSINGFKTINASTGKTWLSVTKLGLAVFTNMIWGSAVSGAHIALTDGGVGVYDGGLYQVGAAGDACLPSCFNYHIINNGGTYELSNATVSVPAALTFNAWYEGSGAGSNANWGTVTYTGTGKGAGSTGKPYELQYNAVLLLNGVTTDMPGTTASSLATGASTDNVHVPMTRGQFSQVSGVCGSTAAGALAYITDSNTNTWGATIAGGGAFTVFGFCNGSTWNVAGK